MWGGRFSEATDAFVAEFTASVNFDKRLYRHDIQGSIAHATMLARAGVLTDAERHAIIEGLTAEAEVAPAHRPLAQRPGGDRHPPLPAR